jgi:DNA polymerase-4
MAEAVRLAPDAVFVPTRHDTYGPYAARVRQVLERYCPVVQTASIDEFFLDFRGCERLYRRTADRDDDAAVERTVRDMRDAIQIETGLPASAGIGSSRPIAKIASGRAKPAGVLMVPRGGEWAFLAPQPVRRFPGIGKVAEAAIRAEGVETLGALMALPSVSPLAGYAAAVRAAVGAVDELSKDRPAFREHDLVGDTEGSLSNERTFSSDLAHPERVDAFLQSLVERVAWRARQREVKARTVTVKLRYGDFETHTHAGSGPPTDAEADLLKLARRLLREMWRRRARVRLLGVALSGLVGPPKQVPLPLPLAHLAPSRAIDAVRARFGYDAIRLAGGMTR